MPSFRLPTLVAWVNVSPDEASCVGESSLLTNLVYAGRFVAGYGIGWLSAVCPTYASEISPKEIRGRIVGQFQVIVVVSSLS